MARRKEKKDTKALARPKRGRRAAAPARGGKKAAAAKVTAAKKGAARKQSAATTRGLRAAGGVAASRGTPRSKPSVASALPGAKARHRRSVDVAVPPDVGPGLSEEDAIRSAKYLPRELPPRPFEEERFIFPESYGVDRVRLLVRDPDWVFAYWDVSADTLRGLEQRLGRRAVELGRLTLRVVDPVSGGSSDILLAPGSRWWYIRTDSARRSYRAELGVTLASGVFHRLAESNTVVTPRVGPSPEPARRRLRYREAGAITPTAAHEAARAEGRTGAAREPWRAPNLDAAQSRPAAPGRGTSSEALLPGASDTHRR
jgi:hypothetical protein